MSRSFVLISLTFGFAEYIANPFGIYYELVSKKVLGYPTEIFDFVLGEVLISHLCVAQIYRAEGISQQIFSYILI